MRRFAALLLALTLILGMVPALAFASSPPTAVTTADELTTALADPAVTDITFANDITSNAQVTVSRPVTIDGAGHELLVGADLGRDNATKHALSLELVADTTTPIVIKNLTVDSARMAYGVNLYSAAAVQFDKVTIKNSKGAGLTVGGSSLTASALNTSGNAWGAVNVDPGVGATQPSVFTITKGNLSEATKIWSDGKNVTDAATVLVNAGAAGFDEQIPAPVVIDQPNLRVWVLHRQTVTTADELTTALADPAVTDITFANDITSNAQVTVSRPVTIDGAGHELIVGADLGRDNATKHALGLELVADTTTPIVIKNLTVDSARMAYGVNLYSAAAVQFDKVTIKNSKGAGLTVGGSSLTASDLNTSGNAWGAVNVDPGVGATQPSVFTITKGNLSEDLKIWSDGKNVTDAATVLVDAGAAGFDEQIPAPVVVDQPNLRVWVLRTSIVTFEANNGSAATTQPATYGSSVSAPVDPTKTGYTFVGWCTEGLTNAWDFSSLVNSDVTLYAKYAINTYQVKFISWNGWSMTKDAEFGSAVTAPDAFPRPGYIFAGWDHSLSNVAGSFTTTALYTKTALLLPPYLSNPVAPSTMSHRAHYTVYGYLKPTHTVGTSPVRIYMWKLSKSGSWTSYGYANAKAYKNFSYTKYASSIRLRSIGRWRLRAYAVADAGHASVWSDGYDYVTVK